MTTAPAPRLPPRVGLADGTTMPTLGLGVWRATDATARTAVVEALASGYRLIDTASIYKNETGVGQGLRDAGLARGEVFVTTKIWNTDQGAAPAHRAFVESLGRLGTGTVDLLLIHWPVPAANTFVETWKALIAMKNDGLVASIGVSNFQPDQLRRLADETGVVPVLNQIELHPYLQQAELRRVHAEMGIQTEAWSPLAQGQALTDPVIAGIAQRLGKTPAQVIIRWHLDMGVVAIPKSVNPERIRENIGVLDFALGQEDLAVIARLDAGKRLGPDPATFS